VSRLLRPLLALAIAAPALVSMAGPAVACSCVDQSFRKVVANADAVVAGHVVGEQPIDTMNTDSVLAVDGVYTGKVEATITLNANIGYGGGSSCAVLYPVGTKVDPLVLQRLDDGRYQVSVCAFPTRAEVVKLLGTARPPPPASASPSAAASSGLPPVALPPRLSWAAVIGGLLLAVGAIGLMLRWSGHRKARRQPSAIEDLQRSARRAAGG